MKIPIAMLADVALDVRGEINPEAINGNVIVDANGQWVGDPTGLVGPAGPPGADGARGPQGERGAGSRHSSELGGDAQVPGPRQDVIPVGGLVIAELIRQPPDFAVNKLQNDTKRGSLTMDGGQLVGSRGVTNAIE